MSFCQVCGETYYTSHECKLLKVRCSACGGEFKTRMHYCKPEEVFPMEAWAHVDRLWGHYFYPDEERHND